MYLVITLIVMTKNVHIWFICVIITWTTDKAHFVLMRTCITVNLITDVVHSFVHVLDNYQNT